MKPPRGPSSSQDVIQRQHEQLQLPEGAAVAADLHRPVLHHVAQVLQLSAACSALLVSVGTNQSVSRETATGRQADDIIQRLTAPPA